MHIIDLRLIELFSHIASQVGIKSSLCFGFSFFYFNFFGGFKSDYYLMFSASNITKYIRNNVYNNLCLVK